MPTLLLTRPEAQSRRLAQALATKLETRPEIVISPMISIALRPEAADLSDVRGVIFTSENGLKAYMSAAPAQSRLPAFCVGHRTARAAAEAGLIAHSAGGTVENLIALILQWQPQPPLAHFHGAHHRGDLAPRLTAEGIETRGQTVYEQRGLPLTPEAKTLLVQGARIVAPLFSPRTATLFRQAAEPLWPGNAAGQLDLVAMSPAVADVVQDWAGIPLSVAVRPDADAMLSQITELMRTVPSA